MSTGILKDIKPLTTGIVNRARSNSLLIDI